MTEYMLMAVKRLSVGVFSYAWSGARGWLSKKRAGKRAFQGDDLASEGSLENIVKVELRKLNMSPERPEALCNDAFGDWMLTEGAVELFVEVMISKAGGNAALARHAEDVLASRYELATGETGKLATGPINLVVSYIYGQLSATDKAKQSLNNALALRNSAHAHALRHPKLSLFPSELDLKHLWRMSADLVTAGKASWKMPAFIAPLTLDVYEGKDEKVFRPITIGELVKAIDNGHSLVLFGDGGIGKTTLLLDLASLCTQELGRRAPLYIDAAVWARSGLGILDYLASTSSAQAHGLTSGDLANLATAGFLVLMINGWNEIPADRKVYCRDILNQLIATAPALAITMASRTEHDATSLPSPRRIVVRGLTWQSQSLVIRSEMGEEAAHALLQVLTKNNRLHHAARSPLILRGLISQVKAGAEASSNVYDLLGAAVMAFEASEPHRLALADGPVFGMQAHYLEELACSLNAHRSTDLSREEALVAFSVAADRLVEKRLLGTVPQPASVLLVLANHHLLHVQDGLVRFAHHRFQEYFAAARLLRIESMPDDLMGLLYTSVNEPAWADSLELVAGKLKASGGSAVARARLVKAAAKVDLAYACDLAGLCAFEENDDAALYSLLVASVTELSRSTIHEVQELAIACQIASRFSAFADNLWARFESADQQIRLHSHRLNGSTVSLSQLGPEMEARIKAWPAIRRSEFMHEITRNPDNYDFLVCTAFNDRDLGVRVAAISALFWGFPASASAIEAWLGAPLVVQIDQDLVRYIGYALQEGFDGRQVREQLQVIAASDIPDESRLLLAITFPDEFGPSAADVVITQLKEEKSGNWDSLILLARAHAPDRLRTLAFELVGAPQGTPDWVGEVLTDDTPEVRTAAFEKTWDVLQLGDRRRLNAKTIGALSSKQQTERSVTAWLHYCDDRGKNLSDTERETGRQIRSLLAHAPGYELLSIVTDLGVEASYEQAVELAELLLSRISPREEAATGSTPWSMTSQQFEEFFDLFSKKVEPSGNIQDHLFVTLARIASHVNPVHFSPLLLKALRRQLDAWTKYEELLAKWEKRPHTQRPANPSLGGYVTSSLANWGIEALPGVLQFLSHQSALELLPHVITHIASLPWASTNNAMFSTVNADIQEGNRRRLAGLVLQQPTTLYQASTDDAAKEIAGILNSDVDRQLFEKENDPKWNSKRAEARIGRFVEVAANLPSAEIVSAVMHALSSGLVGLYSFVGALRGLTRQGWVISDDKVLEQLDALFRYETSSDWIEESKKHTLAQLCQLMLLVAPPTPLNLPLSDLLSQWRRFAHPAEVIRILGGMKTEHAWTLLLDIGAELPAKGSPAADLVFALGACLTKINFIEFAQLVAQGTLFSWSQNDWPLRQISPAVVLALKGNPKNLSLLIESCRLGASPLADALLGEVLSKIDGVDETRLDIALEALDAGRAGDESMPAYRILERFFSQKTSLGGNQFEVYPKACNPLRQQLYHRAKGDGGTAVAARRILAMLECKRREEGRPPDEPRHPDSKDDLAWTDTLWRKEYLRDSLVT